MTLLKPGQAVRCARCAGEWVPSPTAPQPPMVAQPEPAPAVASTPELPRDVIRPARRPPVPRPVPSRPDVALLLAWVASVAVILLAVWGAYAERTTIMEVWPPSVRLYAALGLAADH